MQSLRRPGLLIGLAYVAFISLGLPEGLTGVAWPSIRATFDLPLGALGALIGTITIGYLIASFSAARLMQRLGVGWLLTLSSLITALSLLAYGILPSWALMVGFGVLIGVGAGAIDVGLNTYAAAHFSPRTMNWLHAAFGLGATIGPLVMSAVISSGSSWRLGFLLVGMALLLLTVCFALTRNEWEVRDKAASSEPSSSATMLATLALPTAWLSMLLFVFYTALEVTAGQWLYSLLTEVRGFSPAVAGIWVSSYWGSLTIGRVIAGAIVTWLSLRQLLRFAFVGALIGVILLWLNLTAWLTFAGILLLGFALAPMYPSFMSLTPARMGPQHTANTVGLQVAAAMVGIAAGAGSFGLIADRLGLEALGPSLFVLAVFLLAVYLRLERG